jgi:putative redox protein
VATVNARLTWQDGLRFAARSDSGYTLTLDSVGHEGHAGPSPVELLLISVAGCTGMDVAAILRKMREPFEGIEVEITGERAGTNPKYYTAMEIVYRVRGRGVARDKVERAVELSRSTYCSVSATLRPDCRVTTRVELVDSAP